MNRREFLAASGATLVLFDASRAASTRSLEQHGIRLLARICRYENTLPRATRAIELDPAGTAAREVLLDSSRWSCSSRESPVAGRPDAVDIVVRFRLEKGSVQQTGVSLDLEFGRWSADNYVLLPGAVYNGNRFRSVRIAYPPMLPAADHRPDLPITINDIPRLNNSAGESRLEEFTGDLATPAVGFYSPGMWRGFWILTDQQTRLGNQGLTIEESADRRKAMLRVSAPCVREMRPTINGLIPSTDRGATWNTGDEITIRVRLYTFEAPRLQSLFDRFVEIRKDLTGPTPLRHMVPLSRVWEILEDKYNRENWIDAWGFYSLGARHAGDPVAFIWQLGWVGGCQNTHALLFSGSELSRQRAWRNLDTVLTHSQRPSGFFDTAGDGLHWYSDSFAKPHEGNLALIRKNADALYFFLKQFLLLKKQGAHVPRRWEEGAQRLADAFVTLWNRWGQFGQFIDVENGNIVIGATTSAAIAPAALTLASQYFGNVKYLHVAEQSATLFYSRDVKAGVTTGGPGDALQAPDCESAYHLLESFVVLYELTQNRQWLMAAEEQARQFATWIVSYDYRFPPDSTFAKLGMQTTGTCWANGQNKCAVPGICTASGDALLKLYRATGKVVYLELLRDIVQASPQYMSRADRPIPGISSRELVNPKPGRKLVNLEPGWIFERVQMGDWESPGVPIGETYDATASWTESALMLTWIEIPGLYVQPDTGFVCAFDQIEAKVLSQAGDQTSVRLTNSTKFPARVRTLIESSSDARKPLGFNALFARPLIELRPGEQKDFTFDTRHVAVAAKSLTMKESSN